MGRPLLQLCARPQVPEKTQPASRKNPVDSTNSGDGRQLGTAGTHGQVAPLRCCTETTLKRVTTANPVDRKINFTLCLTLEITVAENTDDT